MPSTPQSSRLRLREPTRAALENSFAMWSNPRRHALFFGDFRPDITPNIDAMPEIGWVLAPHAPG
jgi:hypothetical protein